MGRGPRLHDLGQFFLKYVLSHPGVTCVFPPLQTRRTWPTISRRVAALRSQNATLKLGRGEHRKYAPKVFTEHGALMLTSVLNSERAIGVSVLIVQLDLPRIWSRSCREFSRSIESSCPEE